MKLNKMPIASASLCRTVGLFALPFLISMTSHAQSAGQLTKVVRLPKDTKIRVKIVSNVSSAKAKIGDYVQFKVADDVVLPFEGDDFQILVKKDTVAYGRVVEQRNRLLIFRTGKVGVTLEEILTTDGTVVPVSIARHQNMLAPYDIASLEFMAGQHLRESEREMEQIKCKNLIAKRVQSPDKKKQNVPCIQGRAYLSNLTASLPSAMFAAITGTLLGVEKDKTARDYVAFSLANNLASGLSTILNGSYSEFFADEVFDVTTTAEQWIKIKFPKVPTDLMIRRSKNPPDGYLITDYFSDPVKYPDGERKYYTGMVIERIEDKKKGDTMRICEGQTVPDGFMAIDTPNDPSVCPREPGDASSGPTYQVIVRTKEPPTPKSGPDSLRVKRTSTTPDGFLVTDYFADFVKYTSPRGGAKLYNGKVIEHYDTKKKGETMKMCEGQAVPEDFVVVDVPNDPSVCPREPGDTSSGPTYKLILRMRDPKSP